MNRIKWLRDHPLTLRWLPWVTAGLVLAILLLYQFIDLVWLVNWQPWARWLFYLAFFLALSVFAGGLVGRLGRNLQAQSRLKRQLDETEQYSTEANHRLEAVFKINQVAVEASDEQAVIQAVLQLITELVGAIGSSFVPLDEHCQPLTAISFGRKPLPKIDTWVEYLASPAVRERCGNCTLEHASDNCPLFQEPLQDLREANLICFPIRRGDHEFGMLNLYLPLDMRMESQTRSFLRAVADETALVLEGVRLRRRELAALRQLQDMRQKSDLRLLLQGLLENVHQTLEADFTLLLVQEHPTQAPRFHLTSGQAPPDAWGLLDGLLQGVIRAQKPVLLGDISGDPEAEQVIFALMIAPLVSQTQVSLGAILVGNRRARSFHPRQLSLLQTIAGQVTLVVQNARLMAELEYKTMLEERTRLAREIHDGLAQTLGFLKLQMAQMQSYLERGDLERLTEGLHLGYQAVSEAYLDAREAIDGLHIDPLENSFLSWLRQTATEFEENSGIAVHLQEPEARWDLLPEVQIQLIRIVQEALSNVRKHATANQVQLLCWEQHGERYLEVRDNGQGFHSEDAQAFSRHGLRGMRERADLIGADFQVSSQPGAGVAIRIGFAQKSMEVGL